MHNLVGRGQKLVQVRSHQLGASLRGRLVVEEGVVDVQDEQLLVLPQVAGAQFNRKISA